MKNRSSLSHKFMFYLEKAMDLHSRGRTQALNIELKGHRYSGNKITDIQLSDDAISFSYGDEKVSLSLEDFKMFRRLRTKKYLFKFDAEKKMKKKVKKKASKKSDEAEEKPAKKKASKKSTKKNEEEGA